MAATYSGGCRIDRRSGPRLTGMDLTYPPEAEAFRGEVRAWLEDNLPAGWFDEDFEMSADERSRFNREWPERLHAGGWICATWPKEYGGKGLTTMQGVVLAEEFARAKCSDASRLLRRHARRADDPAVGDRGAEAGVPAQDPARRDALVPGFQRAQLGLGSRQPEDVGRARRRRVGDQRAEGVDDGGTPRRLLLPPHPHRSRCAQAQGHLVPAGADEAARRRGARDHPARWHGGVLRGVLRRRPVPEGRTSSAA